MPGDNPDWLRETQTVADDITPTLSGVAVGTFDIITTPGKSFQSLLLVATSPGATDRSTVQVRIKDPSGVGMLFASYTTTFQSGTTFYPISVPVVANGNIDITVIQNSGTAVPSAFKLYGINVPFGGQQLRRWDGYNYPNGNSGKSISGTATGVTALLAAPISSVRFLLKDLDLAVTGMGAGGNTVLAQVTIGGVLTDLLVIGGAAGAGDHAHAHWEEGCLLDYGTAVNINVLGGAPGLWVIGAVYDSVV